MRAKHWQLFLLMEALPFIINLYFMISQSSNDPSALEDTFYLLFSIIIGTAIFVWIWTVGKSLHNELPKTTNIKIKLFKFSLIFPVCFFLFIILYSETFGNITFNNEIMPVFFILLFILFGFFGCILYCTWFLTNSLRLIEDIKKIPHQSFFWDFFVFWMTPFGIWSFQPRINKIFADNNRYPLKLNQPIE
ncbi:MAG: hypothetical protein V1779_14345 [bacterium]